MEIQSVRNLVMDTNRASGVKNGANIKDLPNNSENNKCITCTVVLYMFFMSIKTIIKNGIHL